MKIAQRDIPTASPSRPSRGIARSRGEALFRARVARRSVGDAVRRTLSGPVGQDTLIASLLTTASLVGLLVHLHVDLPEGGTDVSNAQLDTLGIVLALLQTVPLVWRRVAPVLVLAVCSVAMFLFFFLGYLPSFASFGFLLALYSVAAHRDRRISIPAAIWSAFVVLMILYQLTGAARTGRDLRREPGRRRGLVHRRRPADQAESGVEPRGSGDPIRA